MSMFSSKIGTTESSAKDLDKVRLAKQKKPKKTKEKAVRKVARTVQDTIPYEHVHGKYIFEVEKNRYSVTYSFSDVTYDAADAAEQERIFLAYGDLLNSFDTSDDIQITLHNNVINQKEFSSQILLKHAGDGFDEYRDEYNEMLLDKMQQGQNGITTKKYFTVTVTAKYFFGTGAAETRRKGTVYAELFSENRQQHRKIESQRAYPHYCRNLPRR